MNIKYGLCQSADPKRICTMQRIFATFSFIILVFSVSFLNKWFSSKIIDEKFYHKNLENVCGCVFLSFLLVCCFFKNWFLFCPQERTKRRKKKRITPLVFTLNETFYCTPVVQVMAFINARQGNIYYYGKMWSILIEIKSPRPSPS